MHKSLRRGDSDAEFKILTNSLNEDTMFYKKGDDPTLPQLKGLYHYSWQCL